MRPMTRFVLFDLGGVLFEFDHRLAVDALAPFCDRSGEELFDLVFRSGLEPDYDAGRISTRDLVDELRRRAGFRGSLDDFQRAWGGIFRAKPDSWLLVDRLVAAGIPLGVVSNTNEVHFDALSGMSDFSARFRWLFLSYRLRARKPDDLFYEKVVAHLPFPPSEGLFVDDREENLPPAAARGFRVHRFTTAADLSARLDDDPA